MLHKLKCDVQINKGCEWVYEGLLQVSTCMMHPICEILELSLKLYSAHPALFSVSFLICHLLFIVVHKSLNF
jgi:hypothetical protein